MYNNQRITINQLKNIIISKRILVFFAGIYSISLFPTDFFSNNSYVSENALQPGVADPQYSSKHHRMAVDLTREYVDHVKSYPTDSQFSLSEWCSSWIETKLKEIQLDHVYLHKFIAYGSNVITNNTKTIQILTNFLFK